jgi:hypothetical protein
MLIIGSIVLAMPSLGSISSNPLKDLPALPKVHYSWPIPSYFLRADPTFLDGLMHDFVRVTGTCAPPSISETLNRSAFEACAAICAAVAPVRAQAGLSPPTITLQYDPWQTSHFPSKDVLVTGAAEQAELEFYHAQLTRVHTWLANSSIQVSAVLLDSEKFHLGWPPVGTNETYRRALTRKHDLMYNTTRAVYPRVAIEMYNRGAVVKWDEFAAVWGQDQAYTLEELGESFAVSLYTVPEIWSMREQMNHTIANAKAHNASGRVTAVNPWVALGCGYHRLANVSQPVFFDFAYDYDRVYSWQMGRELNEPAYADRHGFPAWGNAKAVIFYPSVFETRSPAAGPGDNSTVIMQHFASYVRGAAGMDGVAP